MLGPKLRSARVDQYEALGEGGRLLYTVAPRLLEIIKRDLPDIAECFAVPQLSEDGSWIDWYAPEPGVVATWSEITLSEQEEAKGRFVSARDEIIKLQQSFQGRDDDEARLCRDMLKWMFHHPDVSHRFLVNDQPMLTFWGFTHKGARRSQDPLDFSVNYYPDLVSGGHHHVEPVASPDESVPWWKRWWVWLALVLVLLAFFFGLPSIPTDPNTDVPPAAGSQYPPLSPGYDQSLCKKNWGQCANRGWHGGSQ